MVRYNRGFVFLRLFFICYAITELKNTVRYTDDLVIIYTGSLNQGSTANKSESLGLQKGVIVRKQSSV